MRSRGGRACLKMPSVQRRYAFCGVQSDAVEANALDMKLSYCPLNRAAYVFTSCSYRIQKLPSKHRDLPAC
ncbi:hypothetical protein KL918_003426 [Ogataea parapolymorpha]|nr:hypothetical protein KL918_003426 [Ogataea parapolymorpha]KAG7872535.1 hypothetical protein KL916_002930 [Ogataea parapolymorpha]